MRREPISQDIGLIHRKCKAKENNFFYYYLQITGKKIDVLLEVTSPVSLETCKTVMDSLIKMMLEVGLFSEANTLVDDVECATSLSNQELVIEQVRVLGSDGQLRVVYPSRVDLQFESVKVIRPEKV